MLGRCLFVQAQTNFTVGTKQYLTYDEENPAFTSEVSAQNLYGSFSTFKGAGCVAYTYDSSAGLAGLFLVNDSIWHVAQQVCRFDHVLMDRVTQWVAKGLHQCMFGLYTGQVKVYSAQLDAHLLAQ